MLEQHDISLLQDWLLNEPHNSVPSRLAQTVISNINWGTVGDCQAEFENVGLFSLKMYFFNVTFYNVTSRIGTSHNETFLEFWERVMWKVLASPLAYIRKYVTSLSVKCWKFQNQKTRRLCPKRKTHWG